MSRITPDQIIAHVDLLRAVDRLLAEARTLREKREALCRLLGADDQVEVGKKESRHDHR
jgi:hypothetical protein